MVIGARMAQVLAAVAVVASIAGCGTVAAVPGTSGPTPAAPRREPVSSTVNPTTNPLRIIGDWRVLRARGAVRGTPVRFGDQEFDYRHACGELNGEWTAARGGLFLAETGGFDEKCLHTPNLNPVWLRTATRFTVTGRGPARRLTILHGPQVLAVLRRGTYPRAGPDGSAVPGPEPHVTPAIRAGFTPPKMLPAGLTPATARTLVGRWRPMGPVRTGYQDVVLTVRADGDWTGTDGCNGQGSRWESGPDGLLLVNGFIQTLIGCPHAPRASLADAVRAGFRGSVLVLLDRHGAVVDRLRTA